MGSLKNYTRREGSFGISVDEDLFDLARDIGCGTDVSCMIVHYWVLWTAHWRGGKA